MTRARGFLVYGSCAPSPLRYTQPQPSPPSPSLLTHEATTSQDLWQAFSRAFLDELGDWPGPGPLAGSRLAPTASKRDLPYRVAAARGNRGWLNSRTAYFSELPASFGIHQPRIGLVERQVDPLPLEEPKEDEWDWQVVSRVIGTGVPPGASSPPAPNEQRGLEYVAAVIREQ